jgi:radical SAM protein with 4Fe4S-binding SPASM domain
MRLAKLLGDRRYDAASLIAEIMSSAWLELARQAVDNGMVYLLLTGGEVLLRRDFFEIYEPLTRMGLVLTLFTNGTLITKDIAARLAQAPPNRTEITLYGATAATYEAVTGIPGSFAACCAGIEALVSHGVPLGLKTTVTRQNVGELDAMRQMAHNWDLPFLAGWLLTRRPDRTPSDVEDCRLSAADCITVEETDRASARGWAKTNPEERAAERRNIFYCYAGKAAFAINPIGEMNICLILTQPAARPQKTGFAEAWKQLQQYVDSAPPTASQCCSCDALAYCSRCPAWSMLETNTLTEPVPYLCEIARARKESFGQPA